MTVDEMSAKFSLLCLNIFMIINQLYIDYPKPTEIRFDINHITTQIQVHRLEK